MLHAALFFNKAKIPAPRRNGSVCNEYVGLSKKRKEERRGGVRECNVDIVVWYRIALYRVASLLHTYPAPDVLCDLYAIDAS